MSILTWDAVGERLYETGTEKGVLFVQDPTTGVYGTGVAWNGLVSVKQSPDGAEETPLFADNIKYLSMTSAENFKGTIDAYTYPDEFAECDGSAEVGATGMFLGQQPRSTFGMAYTTVVGNDVAGNAYGEKLHVIYGAKVAPSERAYETINDDPSAITFSWGFTTTPASVSTPGLKPTAYLCFDSTKMTAGKYQAILDLVHGTELLPSELPSIDDFITIVNAI